MGDFFQTVAPGSSAFLMKPKSAATRSNPSGKEEAQGDRKTAIPAANIIPKIIIFGEVIFRNSAKNKS
jgi:hypothetical protein